MAKVRRLMRLMGIQVPQEKQQFSWITSAIPTQRAAKD